jgi:hypothetical protein
MKRVSIDNKFYDVVSEDEFNSHLDVYNTKLSAVERDGYIFPVISTTDTKVGINNQGALNFYNYPETVEDMDKYNSNKIIDTTDCKSITEFMSKRESIRDLEKEMLTSPDNITIPIVSVSDTPEMKGLKMAIIAKHIDLDKYSDRFGENYPNDKRALKGHSATIKLLRRFCNNLDLKAKLILEDTSPNAANLMGKEIVIDIMSDE